MRDPRPDPELDPEKARPNVIRGGIRFFEKIMLH
jgi:hypothetical protein